jgi:hypothetical protein
VSDGSGTTGRLACAGKGTFVSGVLTVIVVVPPGTVEVIRRVMVLVMSSWSLYGRQQLYLIFPFTMRYSRYFLHSSGLVDRWQGGYCSALNIGGFCFGHVFLLDRRRHAVSDQSLRDVGNESFHDELRRACDSGGEVDAEG